MDGKLPRHELVTQAKELACHLEKKAQREAIPVHTRFLRDVHGMTTDASADTPLTRLVKRGDRDGITIRLYLGLLWISTAAPFDSSVPAATWATLLAIDPKSNYRRRINSALTRLEETRLIRVERQKGRVSRIFLLDPGGTGGDYTPPIATKDPANTWIKIPTSLWQQDGFYELKTPGLAMLLAIYADGHQTQSAWWSEVNFKRRIGLSPSTRARGIKELQDAKLITVKKAPINTGKQAFTRSGYRNIYHLRPPIHSVDVI